MTIEVSCLACLAAGRTRVVATASHWSRAVTIAAVHEHPQASVRVVAVVSRDQWQRMPRDYKGLTNGQRSAMHLDSDGSTILVPVEVRP
jgi:hypothetical protein